MIMRAVRYSILTVLFVGGLALSVGAQAPAARAQVTRIHQSYKVTRHNGNEQRTFKTDVPFMQFSKNNTFFSNYNLFRFQRSSGYTSISGNVFAKNILIGDRDNSHNEITIKNDGLNRYNSFNKIEIIVSDSDFKTFLKCFDRDRNSPAVFDSNRLVFSFCGHQFNSFVIQDIR